MSGPSDVNTQFSELMGAYAAAMRRLCTAYTHTTPDGEDLFQEIGAAMSDQTLQRIAQWLGIEPTFVQTKPRYRKQSVLPLEATIENYDEVAQALSGTDFEYCLEDEAIYRAGGRAPEAVASQAS